MQVMTFPRLVYVADTGTYVPEDEAPPGARVLTISGTQLRQRLADGEELPDWFMPPEVAAVLVGALVACCGFFTGADAPLSCAGAGATATPF